MKIAVIGGGISGLTAAFKLQQRGHSVTVYERRDHPGGSVKSVLQNGWLLEYGPNTLQLKSEKVRFFLREIGLEDKLIDANPEAVRRFIVRDEELTEVPSGILSFLSTPLLSAKGKLRLLMEPFSGRTDNPEETLADFTRRRAGSEFLNYAIDPLIAGIYAGSPDQLSLRHTFPSLYKLEQTYGSLTAGLLARTWEKRKADKFSTRLVSFENGMQTLPDRIGSKLEDLRCNQEVTHIQKTMTGWEVTAGGSRLGGYDKVFLNIPLYRVSKELIDGGGALEEAEKICSYPPLSIIYTGYERQQIKHPLDGFGFLVPASEDRKILGSLFSSTLFPGRAPDDHILLTTFVGGVRQPGLARAETSDLVRMVYNEHRQFLGLDSEPVFIDHVFWPKSIPQYVPGYDHVLKAVKRVEESHEGLHLLGNFRGGVSVPDCIESALKAVDSVLASS